MLSVHEATWNKETKRHSCCGSPHTYHYGHCPTRSAIVPGRLADPTLIDVQELKSQGLNSSEVAKRLGLAISHVNDLWIL